MISINYFYFFITKNGTLEFFQVKAPKWRAKAYLLKSRPHRDDSRRISGYLEAFLPWVIPLRPWVVTELPWGIRGLTLSIFIPSNSRENSSSYTSESIIIKADFEEIRILLEFQLITRIWVYISYFNRKASTFYN